MFQGVGTIQTGRTLPLFEQHTQLNAENLVNLTEVQMLYDRLYIHNFLHAEDLERIHGQLWYAGRRGNVSPRHHHKVLHRNIILTESPRLHLVWFDKTIYVQRLPTKMCNWDYCNLIIGNDSATSQAASGFFLSYMRLIQSPPDLELAKALSLIDKDIEWKAWYRFRQSVLTHLHGRAIHDRFEYGELRLGRLNTIFRLRGLGLYYFTIHRDYSSYFASNYASLIALFALVSVALSAFQVIAGIDGVPVSVVTTAYRFSIAALVVMVASGTALVILFAGLFAYHCVMTHRRRERGRNKGG